MACGDTLRWFKSHAGGVRFNRELWQVRMEGCVVAASAVCGEPITATPTAKWS